jgi:tetratricopeptide (TPR) repeat protein
MPCRWSLPVLSGLLLSATLGALAWGQTVAPVGTGKSPSAGPASDIELVEKLLVARKEYENILRQLRAHYVQVGDLERAKWAEEELRQYHRIPKQAFRLELDVPPPTLQANTNIPEANKLYMRAMAYKDKGFYNDYIDNQRRAEILLQQLLTQYPQSNKISDAAYQLGDIYESKAYRQYRRAASYFERCYQWNPTTHFDARLRAARIYDRQLLERGKAIEIYRDILNHETDPRQHEEAQKRLTDLSTAH